MQKDYNETDPERKIFRTALNSIQIEPSEKFWNGALHGIIDKENALNKKRVQTWKGVSFTLAAGIALFAIHDIWVNSKLDKIEQDIVSIKDTQIKTIEKENTTRAIANNTAANINTVNRSAVIAANVTEPQNAGVVKTKINSSAINNPISSVSRINNLGLSQNTSNTQGANRSFTQSIAVNSSANSGGLNNGFNTSTTSGRVEDNTSSNSATINSGDIGNNNTQVSNGSDDNGNIPVTNSTNKVSDVKQQSDSSLGGTKQVIAETKKQSDSSQAVAKPNVIDSTGILSAYNKPPKPKIDLRHKVSVSAFFAPGALSDFLNDKDNDDGDNISVKALKARESDWFAYQAGVKAGIDISPKLTARIGVYYDLYTYNINESVISAQQQADGTVGYSIVTSSGVINVPYTSNPYMVVAPPKLGDSIKVHGSSSRGYICIPLQLSYNFFSRNRLGLFAEIGTTANIAFNTQTEINWQNTFLQEGGGTVSTVEGLDRVSYSYSIGIGANYKLWRGLSVFGEPLLQGSITSINKSAPISAYPYFFGVSMGVTYHF